MVSAVAPIDPLRDAICAFIRTGELSPGERVDQRAMSDRLKVSRTPLRETLRALASDGILTRTPNAGYAVAKLSAVDLLQYYSIRAFLETEVLRTIEWPDADQLEELKAAALDCERAAEDGAVDALVEANRRFHFIMFRWSPLKVMINEIERVWRVSDPYRALHLTDPTRRKRVPADHQAMITAIEKRDAKQLIKLMDAHRDASRNILQDMLGPTVPMYLRTLPQSSS